MTKTLKIALADDDEIELSGLIGRLKSVCLERGIDTDITKVSDGTELVDVVSENQYNLVFTDNQMKEMNGLTATEKIRSSGNKVPVYLLSKNMIPENTWKKAGCSGYIQKPLSYDSPESMGIFMGDTQERILKEFDAKLRKVIGASCK